MPELGGDGGGGQIGVVGAGGGCDGGGGEGGGGDEVEGWLQGLSQAEHIVHSIWYFEPTHDDEFEDTNEMFVAEIKKMRNVRKGILFLWFIISISSQKHVCGFLLGMDLRGNVERGIEGLLWKFKEFRG